MLQRVAEHYVGIRIGSEKKYRLLSEIQRNGHPIEFDVLYYAQKKRASAIREEIGSKEGEYIRQFRPVLNTQIPKADNWRSYEINEIASTITLSEILQ